MPPRSPWMKRRIFGFQRRVWWPKWTPPASSSAMPTAATGYSLFMYAIEVRANGVDPETVTTRSLLRAGPAPRPHGSKIRIETSGYPFGAPQRAEEVRGQRRVDLDALTDR